MDPKAVPSRLAWEAGVALADSLLRATAMSMGGGRGRRLSVGHSAMRARPATIAEVLLALLGLAGSGDRRPRRVIDLAPMQPAAWAARAST